MKIYMKVKKNNIFNCAENDKVHCFIKTKIVSNNEEVSAFRKCSACSDICGKIASFLAPTDFLHFFTLTEQLYYSLNDLREKDNSIKAKILAERSLRINIIRNVLYRIPFNHTYNSVNFNNYTNFAIATYLISPQSGAKVFTKIECIADSIINTRGQSKQFLVDKIDAFSKIAKAYARTNQIEKTNMFINKSVHILNSEIPECNQKNESESIINKTEIEIEEIKNKKSPFDPLKEITSKYSNNIDQKMINIRNAINELNSNNIKNTIMHIQNEIPNILNPDNPNFDIDAYIDIIKILFIINSR